MSLEEQLIKIETAEATAVDLGICNDRYFLNGVGIGFEGAVAKDLAGKKKRPGKASFLIAILKRLFFYSSKDYRIHSEEIYERGKYLFIDIANGQRAGGGFHIAPLSAIDDGWLDLVMVNKLHPLLRLRYLPVIEKGKHLALDFVKHHKTKKVRIESDSDMLAHLDGELYIARQMEIGLLPAQLRIIR
jgi:diacylglycerol kinase (ATP)